MAIHRGSAHAGLRSDALMGHAGRAISHRGRAQETQRDVAGPITQAFSSEFNVVRGSVVREAPEAGIKPSKFRTIAYICL